MAAKFLKSSIGKILPLSSLLLILLPAAGRASTSAPPAPPAPPARLAKNPPKPPTPAPDADSEDQSKSKHGWLGVFLSEDEDGVTITGVKTDGPAEKAGLKEGDRFVEIDGNKVGDSEDIRRAIHGLEPGDTVQIVVMREGKKKTVTATLGEAPKSTWSMEGFPGAHYLQGLGNLYVPGMGISRTYLGVRVQSMTEELREYFKAPRGRGVLVSRVEEDTPAAKAGLRAGDVIIAVNGKGIAERGDIAEALADKEPGDTVPVKIVRDGSEKTLTVEIAERSTPKAHHGALVLPGGDKTWIEGDDEDNDIEIQDLEDVPDHSQIHREVERAMEQARAAMKDSILERKELEKELKEARKAAAEVSSAQIKAQIDQELAAARALAGPQSDAIRRQVEAAMEQAREALRQAAEAARRVQPGNEI